MTKIEKVGETLRVFCLPSCRKAMEPSNVFEKHIIEDFLSRFGTGFQKTGETVSKSEKRRSA